MRVLFLLAGLSAHASQALSAQHHWQTLDAPTSPPLSVDLQSLKVLGTVVSVLVRTPIGAGVYRVQPHDVRCTDLSVRLGPGRSYDADTPRIAPAPSPDQQRSKAECTRYGPNSDGQLTAAAICSLARKRGLLRQQTSSLG
jgi:hypothetical protein